MGEARHIRTNSDGLNTGMADSHWIGNAEQTLLDA